MSEHISFCREKGETNHFKNPFEKTQQICILINGFYSILIIIEKICVMQIWEMINTKCELY